MLVMDLEAVRAFAEVADSHQFQAAGARLGISQQAVSKRIAALEKELGRRLFARTPRGALLTLDGQALLPRAKELLRAEARALAAVRPDRRPLRVDVVTTRGGPAELLRSFHQSNPEIALDVITMFDAATAVDAVINGAIDATFRAAPVPGFPLPKGLARARVLDEALMLLTSPQHPLAARPSVTLAELAAYTVWMPGVVAGTEWAVYYTELTAAFGLRIDTSGPNFGSQAMLNTLWDDSTRATFTVRSFMRNMGAAHDGLRLIELRDPTPVYPHSFIWHRDNNHPALAPLRDNLGEHADDMDAWAPAWARHG
jgi:DNA-binding transcriptional LysR family regulator